MTPNLDEDIRYCPYCRASLERRIVAGRERPYCPCCQRAYFSDPKLAVAVIVASGDRILLQQRAIEPGLGLWSFPSGFVERGEELETAARREVLEETGLEVGLLRLVGVYSRHGEPVVLVVYEGQPRGGVLRTSEESQAVHWFALDALPPLAFPHDERILRDWLRARSTG
ncbi:MAG: NUDIX hydrolase [Thermomicrobium sp.]|nr:NUDIX hydrolase [Thermomicrobium sp.]MDW8058527.1 NUDIX hydrolase [Thermomicrobium sp.]